jgi:hypothetical protein
LRVVQGTVVERRATPWRRPTPTSAWTGGRPVSPATLRLCGHTIGRWLRAEPMEVRRFEDLEVAGAAKHASPGRSPPERRDQRRRRSWQPGSQPVRACTRFATTRSESKPDPAGWRTNDTPSSVPLAGPGSPEGPRAQAAMSCPDPSSYSAGTAPSGSGDRPAVAKAADQADAAAHLGVRSGRAPLAVAETASAGESLTTEKP